MKKYLVSGFVVLLLSGIAYNIFPETELPPGTKIDKLVVMKHVRKMDAYGEGKLLKTYHISLGRNPIGDKGAEGDNRTPEGSYIINDKNPESGYHRNLGISYPDKNDKADAKERNVKPGGEIKIHGIRNGLGFIGKFHRFMDWTAGCIALTNDEVEELYAGVEIGTPIIIEP